MYKIISYFFKYRMNFLRYLLMGYKINVHNCLPIIPAAQVVRAIFHLTKLIYTRLLHLCTPATSRDATRLRRDVT